MPYPTANRPVGKQKWAILWLLTLVINSYQSQVFTGFFCVASIKPVQKTNEQVVSPLTAMKDGVYPKWRLIVSIMWEIFAGYYTN